MERLSISKFARRFGLSRSTLLYYEKEGLLPPPCRTGSGYRFYTEKDCLRMQRLCDFREAGLSLGDIRTLLASSRKKPTLKMLEKRFQEIGSQIADMKAKQRLLGKMMQGAAKGEVPRMVDKALWVEMLRAAGMSEEGMARWHASFEQRAPDAHHEFLLSLGITGDQARRIRNRTAA